MEIIKGENAIVRINLTQADGTTALLYSDCLLIKAEVIQLGRVLVTYIAGTDAEIRQGATTSQVEIEIKKAVTESFIAGTKVQLKLYIETANAEFSVDGEQSDIMIEDIFTSVVV